MIPVLAKIHRCDSCGKWSFAKRKPKEHKRFIRDGIGVTKPPEQFIIARLEAEYFGEDEVQAAGWEVWCGPFTTFDVIEEHK